VKCSTVLQIAFHRIVCLSEEVAIAFGETMSLVCTWDDCGADLDLSANTAELPIGRRRRAAEIASQPTKAEPVSTWDAPYVHGGQRLFASIGRKWSGEAASPG
jgi:hypothetical protein